MPEDSLDKTELIPVRSMSDTLPMVNRRDIEGPASPYGNANAYGQRAETDEAFREDLSDKSEN